jgi:cellulose synthase/poly-beta-1,6-N-acetylglucosamine synthase-like glycosyltransferase
MSERLNVFTIVLNGMPYLRRVWDCLRATDTNWRWTIVHGVADPVADTSWCKTIEAPTDDGTLALLAECESSPRVTVIRQPRWPGKTAMCNAALATFDRPGVLIQMDADEIWAPRQLLTVPTLFERYPLADAAMFFCRYWFGPRRFVCTPNAFGNHIAYEWIRAWRFTPGATFERHEPPVLRGAEKYLSHAITSQVGLVFDHYAYASRAQVEFKQAYYGPEYDPAAWDRLQEMRGPVDLCGVLPWVKSPVISYEV